MKIIKLKSTIAKHLKKKKKEVLDVLIRRVKITEETKRESEARSMENCPT